MPPADTTNPTKAALEAAVLDLTDEELVRALRRASPAVKDAFDARAAYTWPSEAQRNLFEALLRRLQGGRVSPA
jgi:hypothetical protein